MRQTLRREDDRAMPQDSRNLKITCLVTLAFGLVSLLFGAVVILPAEPLPTGPIALVDGVLVLILGVQGARWANVPSNAKRVMRAAVVVLMLSLLLSLLIVLTTQELAFDALAVTVGAALLSLAILLLARAVARRLERA